MQRNMASGCWRWDSVSLKVAVTGGRVAPHLTLRAIVENVHEKGTLHVGRLDFYSGGVHGVGAQIIDLTLSREATEGKQTDGDFDGSYLCKFYTHRGTPSSLWLSTLKHIPYDQDTIATFRELQKSTHHAVTASGAGTVQVVLKIRAKVSTHDDNEVLWKALQNLADAAECHSEHNSLNTDEVVRAWNLLPTHKKKRTAFRR